MKHRTEVKVIYVDAIYGLVEDGRFSDSIRNLSVVLMVGCGNNEKSLQSWEKSVHRTMERKEKKQNLWILDPPKTPQKQMKILSPQRHVCMKVVGFLYSFFSGHHRIDHKLSEKDI